MRCPRWVLGRELSGTITRAMQVLVICAAILASLLLRNFNQTLGRGTPLLSCVPKLLFVSILYSYICDYLPSLSKKSDGRVEIRGNCPYKAIIKWGQGEGYCLPQSCWLLTTSSVSFTRTQFLFTLTLLRQFSKPPVTGFISGNPKKQ